MKLNECINFQLTNVQNVVFSFFKKELQPYDVTPIQYALLKCLWEEDNQMPSQLAQSLNLDSSTITGILGRLEDKQLIVRDFNKTDRRRVNVLLTESGLALRQPIEETIERANATVMDGFTPEDISQLQTLLQLVTKNAVSA